MLILESPWTRQPQTVVDVDWSNAVTNNLINLWGFNGAAIELSRKQLLTATGSIAYAPTLAGIGVDFSATGNSFNAGTQNVITTGNITVLAYFAPNVTTRGDLVTRWDASGGTNRQFNLLYGLTSAAPQFFVQGSGSSSSSGASSRLLIIKKPSVVIGIHNTTTTSVYVDGLMGATASTFSINQSANLAYVIGDNAANDGNFNGVLLLAAVWDRALSPMEIAAVSANPWQLFAPRRIPIPTPAAAGYTHPTLSLATATEIGATSFKPSVTYTFA